MSEAGARRRRFDRRTRPRSNDPTGLAAAFAALMVVSLLLAAAPAGAQLPYLDPLPFWTPSDSLACRAFRVEITRHGDGRTGWTADRLLVDARLPLGARGCFLVRMPWLRSDIGSQTVSSRWPALMGPEAAAGWPGESVVAGVGQLELGAAGPLSLPWLGALNGAIAVGVPLGKGRLYPWSTAGIPARLGLTRWFSPRSGWWFGAGAVLVAHGGQGGEVLDPLAFPDGWQTTVSIERGGADGGLRLGWDRQARSGRQEQTVSAEGWLPWSGGNRVGVRATREITGSADRVAAWSLGLVWRLEPRAPTASTPEGKPGAASAGR